MEPYQIDRRVVRDKPRGVLNLRAGQRWFRVGRYCPAEKLATLVEHYWTVHWDRRGREPYVQHTLSNASCHLVFERNNSRILGVIRGRFTRLLEGAGWVFGVKFSPAGFRPYWNSAVSSLADRSIPIAEVFGADGDALARQVESIGDEHHIVGLVDTFLTARLPAEDPRVDDVNRIVATIISDREIVRVDDIVDRFQVSKRALQRLFSEYVGVTPKWVIQRYRLHEAAERLAEASHVSVVELALELGYFDQAHFVRDFKSVVGKPPAEYARLISLSEARRGSS